VQLVRNFLSDEAMFADLKESTYEYDVDEYIRNGWRHVEEAETEIKPLVAFNKAKSERTVQGLRTFVSTYPEAKYVPEARELIHTLYGESLANFKEHAATGDPTIVPFMEQLLLWLETHDTAGVQVRFLPPSSEMLGIVDTLLAGDGGMLDGRPVAPVAPYFTDDKNLARESAIVGMMQDGFGRVFPNDVLVMQSGERLTPEQAALPVAVPTLEVAYSVGASGSVYELEGSQRMFVGIIVVFDVNMRIPDVEPTISFNLPVEPPQTFSIETFDAHLIGLIGSDPSDDSVYQVMALRAFDELGTKVRTVFFNPELLAPPVDPGLEILEEEGVADPF
jgi:hypothetical protein